MAYKNTYEDLLKDIQESGQTWSSYDLELARDNPDAGRSIFSQKQAYANAQTEEQRKAANDAAEMIRRQYGGYTAGSDGSGFSLTGYNKAPEYTQYTSKYQSQINDLMSQLANRPAFSYTPTDDPSYAAYSEHYRNSGEQARKDTLAQAAAMTGGQPSTYAIAAAEQAQNAHNATMSDMIPQLRDAAYAMYADEGNAMRNDLNMLLALDEMEYGRHQDAYANQMAKWQADYGVDRDMVEDQRYENELELAMRSSTGSRGGSNVAGSQSGIVETMLGMNNDVDAYEYLIGQGLTTTAINQLWKLYQTEKDKQKNPARYDPILSDFTGGGDIDNLVNQVQTMFGNAIAGGNLEAVEAMLRDWGYGSDVIDAVFSRLNL